MVTYTENDIYREWLELVQLCKFAGLEYEQRMDRFTGLAEVRLYCPDEVSRAYLIPQTTNGWDDGLLTQEGLLLECDDVDGKEGYLTAREVFDRWKEYCDEKNKMS